MARFLPIALLVGSMLASSLGCHLPGPARTAAPASWVERHGGLSTGPEIERAREVARSLGQPARPEVDIVVLASAAPSAFAWPSGEIYLTRGLVESLGDEDLAAAIAHEVGHLIDDGHLERRSEPGELAGRGQPETRADRLGMQLLESRGIPSLAMVRMLERLRSQAGPETEVGRALARRIAALGAVTTADRGTPGPR